MNRHHPTIALYSGIKNSLKSQKALLIPTTALQKAREWGISSKKLLDITQFSNT